MPVDGEQRTAAAAESMAEYSQLMMRMAQTMAMQSALGSIPPFDGTNLRDFNNDQLPCFLKKVLGILRGSA